MFMVAGSMMLRGRFSETASVVKTPNIMIPSNTLIFICYGMYKERVVA